MADELVLSERLLPKADRKPQDRKTRLSWPRIGDTRRSIVGKSAPRKSRARHFHDVHGRIVHVSSVDVEMHYYLTGLAPKGSALPTLYMPVMDYSTAGWNCGEKQLFQYFQYTASRSLATFSHNPIHLGNSLMRIAMAGSTTSSKAVLQSLLALSSLHRHDIHMQAWNHKISALKALAAASRGQIGTKEAVQHVAAGMLLCSFEIHISSCTSNQWTWYIRGVKDVINAIGIHEFQQDRDLLMLLDWVRYHEVLAHFSLLHWLNDENTIPHVSRHCIEQGRQQGCMPRDMNIGLLGLASYTAPSALALIELLSEVSSAVLTAPKDDTAVEDVENYRNYLQILDWRIRSTVVTVGQADGMTPEPAILELYRLAMLVYLNRASGKLLNQAARTKEQVDRAFDIFSGLASCDRQFPVFILGCEARTDEQREVVLDLIARTEVMASSRSFNYVRLLLHAIWAQDDLADGPLNYLEKMNFVISCCNIVPTFV